MRLLQINSIYPYGSTGKICYEINNLAKNEYNIDSKVIYFWGKKSLYANKMSNLFYEKTQALKSRLFGLYGMTSNINTTKVIKFIKKFNPDIIHLHNVHDHTINIYKLLKYISSTKIKLCWTFHDSWAFTGYCTHFSLIGCCKWKYGCNHCPQRKNYSWFFDRSEYLFNKKLEAIKNLDITVVTPSKWLGQLVEKSFFSNNRIKVINNGINLSVFKHSSNNFRDNYGLNNKFVLLGVAFDWGYKKGLDIFIRLAKDLSDDFKIVLVGTNAKIDKLLPKNILSIHRTCNQEELAQIYSSADLFINPTREDNYPTVNMESIACGTPVIAFNTGGCSENVNKYTGKIIDFGNYNELKNIIIQEQATHDIKLSFCNSNRELFDEKINFRKYFDLYKIIYNE